MADDIQKKFGWKLHHVSEEKLFLIFLPSGLKISGKAHQIDVYGFECNRPSKGLINFPWDNVTVSMNAFLPLMKHKKIPAEQQHFYVPFNPPCLLANMYGGDFMTPKKGHFIREIAYDDPKCGVHITLAQHHELERQLSFAEQDGVQQTIAGGKVVTEEVAAGPLSSDKSLRSTTPELRRRLDAAKGRFGIISCIR